MKQLRPVFATLVLLMAVFRLQAQTPKFETAVDYNDFIVDNQNEIGYKILAFNETFGNGTVEDTRRAHKVLVETIQTSLKNIQQAPPFRKGTDLRDTAVDLFSFYLEIVENEYAEMIDLVYTQEFTEASQERLNEMLAGIQEREGPLDEAFSRAQNAFATEYGFKLEDNELSEEFKSEE